MENEKRGKSNVMAIISYIGPLCLIPIITKEQDESVKFHAKQGLVLFACEAATGILSFALPIIWFVINLLGVVWFVLSVIGIMNVINDKKGYLPLIGKFADKIKL